MIMPIEIDGETYLTTRETCERLGVSRETINNYVNKGILHRYKQGIKRNAYYKETEVNRLLEVREDSNE